MAKLILRILPSRRKVLAGESLPVDVSLINRGDTAVDVDSPDGQSPFEFLLRSIPEGTTVFSASARRQGAALAGDSAVIPPRRLVAIEPAQVLRYPEDVTAYASALVPPAEYELQVLYDLDGELLESPLIPLEVEAPRVSALAGRPEGQGLGLIFAHRGPEEPAEDPDADPVTKPAPGSSDPPPPEVTVLLENEGFPLSQGAHRRVQTPAVVDGLARAMRTGIRPVGGQWCAWLEGNKVGAVVGWGGSTLKKHDAVEHGLEGARLFEVGWQDDEGRAVFLVVGKKDGVTSLAVTTVTGDGITFAVHPLPGSGELSAFGGTFDGRNIHVVWVGSEQGATRGRIAKLDAGAAGLQPARVVLESPLPLLAFGVPARATGATFGAHVLVGPDADGLLHVARVECPDGGVVTSRSLAQPPVLVGEKVDAWRLAGVQHESARVLARAGNRLMASPASSWQTVTTDASPGALAVVEAPDVSWVVWADPRRGVRSLKLG